MKYIRTLLLVTAMALTLCFATAANVSAAETDTVETVTQEETTETSEEYNSSDIFYVVFIGSALFGSLVALGFWIVFKS